MAGAIWGLSYIIPVLMMHFNAIEITIGRYFVYGLFSIVYFAVKSPVSIRSISMKHWRFAMFLALTGNVIYYGMEVMGVKILGADVVAIIFALLPVITTLLANLIHKEFKYRTLMPSLVLLTLGLVVVHIEEVHFEKDITSQEFMFGFGLTLCSIILWSVYALYNASFLKSQREISASTLSTLVGICCLISSLAIYLLLAMLGSKLVVDIDRIFRGDAKMLREYIFYSSLLGILVSWFGTYMWNYASLHLPRSVSGQLVVSEVVFGLIYSFIFYQRVPNFLEFLGFGMILAGILLTLFVVENERRKAKSKSPNRTQ